MLLASLAIAALPLWQLNVSHDGVVRRAFTEPIDAVSIALPSPDASAEVRGLSSDGTWSAWEPLERDDEQEPGLLESSLVMFPKLVTSIELRGDAANAPVHPIRVESAPFSYKVAGPDPGTPHILSREDWGANDDLLFTDRAPAPPSEPSGDNGDAATSDTGVSAREQDCLDAQRDHPDEFKTVRKTTSVNGSTLRWAHTYSKKIDLFVVHHTAVAVGGDARSGVERVRAIYQYHAQNRGWGDVGYHYLIDEDGQIYEGKSGGDYVVAGHAYCHNVNTIGIALLGNFEVEKPSQDQMKALQWLLDDLADTYDVDLGDNADYHGVPYSSPVVGHGDLLSTSCPGFYVAKTLSQVRTHVKNGDLDASISFPKKPTSSSSKSSRSTSSRSTSARPGSSQPGGGASSRAVFKEGISVLGSATLGGRPGGEVPFSVRYVTGERGAVAGERIAKVKRSDQAIGVWQLLNGEYVPVRGDIVTESSVPRHSSTAIQMKVQIPRDRGPYSIAIGDAVYVITPSGRVTTPGQSASSVRSTQTSSSTSRSSISRRPFVPASSSRTSSARSSSSALTGDRGPIIKIRLESRDASLDDCGDADLTALRKLYRGTVTCEDIDGDAALINEVALEDYLMGLSEEPDTEPYEKQRAFAIAARTYAAHYMQDSYRKFPGKPYDGSDSPAIFQKYTGESFEGNNPHWLEAVKSTANKVLTKDDQLIRPAYFSSDDGRTRAPSEIGWKTFPFIEIFTSKDDPWCAGMENRGHGVGMSGCGAEGQANEGKSGEEILRYYYPGTILKAVSGLLD